MSEIDCKSYKFFYFVLVMVFNGPETRISMRFIVELLQSYMDLFNSSLDELLSALIYIDRLFAKNTEFVMTPKVLKGITLTALCVSSKFHSD